MRGAALALLCRSGPSAMRGADTPFAFTSFQLVSNFQETQKPTQTHEMQPNIVVPALLQQGASFLHESSRRTCRKCKGQLVLFL